MRQYGVALFYDIGNAMRHWDDPLEQGAGVGARWISPVGMVRIDVAYPLTDRDRQVRFHLTVGPDL
jgi:translocation and assembly module TamA